MIQTIQPATFLACFKHVERARPKATVESVRPDGNYVDLADYRLDMKQKRLDSVGKPGVRLDGSPTGAGKTYADLAAFKAAGEGVTIQPTHANGKEVVASMRSEGIDAVKYPKRTTDKDSGNCWNSEADEAEALGLSVQRAVCLKCSHEKRCLGSGYLAEMEEAKASPVVVATHARAKRSGLNALSNERKLICVHEDSLDVLVPVESFSVHFLNDAQRVVLHLLHDPEGQAKFEPVFKPPEEGLTPVCDEHKTARRQKRREFLSHLADVIRKLIDAVAESSRDRMDLPNWRTLQEADGVQALILSACGRLGVRFRDGKQNTIPVWSVLLAIATGEFQAKAILTCRRNENCELEKHLVITRKNLPDETKSLWLEDATADCGVLCQATGIDIENETPDGRLKLCRNVIQFPHDITKNTATTTVLGYLRAVIASHPDCHHFGIITHKEFIDVGDQLRQSFRGCKISIGYFGSGSDRASNEWLDARCDLLIVAGTPRIGELEIKKVLFQCGMRDAIERGSVWGSLSWRVRTPSGQDHLLSGRGYQDEDWRRIHQMKVRAGIIQAAGRGRPILQDGCDVVILSNEESGFPVVATGEEIIPFGKSEFPVLTELHALIDIREKFGCATASQLSFRCGVGERQCEKLLKRLAARGLVERIGKRGGWRPSLVGIRLVGGQTR